MDSTILHARLHQVKWRYGTQEVVCKSLRTIMKWRAARLIFVSTPWQEINRRSLPASKSGDVKQLRWKQEVNRLSNKRGTSWKRRDLIRGQHRNGREIFSSIIIQFSLFILFYNFFILKKGIKSFVMIWAADLGMSRYLVNETAGAQLIYFVNCWSKAYPLLTNKGKKHLREVPEFCIQEAWILCFHIGLIFLFMRGLSYTIAKCNGLVIWTPSWRLMKLFFLFQSKQCIVCFLLCISLHVCLSSYEIV